MKFRINYIIFLFFSIPLTTLHAQFEEIGIHGSSLKEDKSYNIASSTHYFIRVTIL